MKILHVYKTYFPASIGGVEQVIRQIVGEVQKYNIESRVLTMTRSGSEKTVTFENHQVIECDPIVEIASTPFSYKAFRKYRELSEWADVLHFHFPYPFADLLQFVVRSKKPIVVTYHSDIVKQRFFSIIYRPLMCWFLRSARFIVATSPQYLESSYNLQQFRESAVVIPLGLNEEYYLGLQQEEIGELPPDFFLFVGVLRYYKGLQYLIEAALASDFPILIAGDGPLRLELESQITRNGLGDRVLLLGQITEEKKAMLLSRCVGLVFPSCVRSEAFGVTLLEASMYGKPIISCDLQTGTSYVNQSDVTGFVIPPRDSNALAEAMKKLWEDRELGSRMGAAARKRFETHFRMEEIGNKYLDLYNRALG